MYLEHSFDSQLREVIGDAPIDDFLLKINRVSDARFLADNIHGLGIKRANLLLQGRQELDRFVNIRQIVDINGIGLSSTEKLLNYYLPGPVSLFGSLDSSSLSSPGRIAASQSAEFTTGWPTAGLSKFSQR